MSRTMMTADQIRNVAPSVFASSPWERMSDRYKMVPTSEVIEILADGGFRVVRAQQSKSRIEGKGDFTKHLLRFRHENDMTRFEVGNEIPEIVLVNSHDGTSAYQLSAGIFRVACLNGLMVQTDQFGSISVRHSGGSDFASRIVEATQEIVEEIPRTLGKIEDWKRIELSAPKQEAFASAALELRDNARIAPRQLLAPRRSADVSPDLWTTFNRIQENTLQGGLRAVSDSGRRTRTRPVKSVNEDTRLNRALWHLAEKMAELA